MQPVRFQKMYPEAQLPFRAYPGDAGLDLTLVTDAIIASQTYKDLSTGIAVEFPPGYYGRITGRSSTWRLYGLTIIEGLIDERYRGELLVAVLNPSWETKRVRAGMRLAQLVIHKNENVSIEEVEKIAPSERGDRGFGSSGA